jgi:hypothetical protein
MARIILRVYPGLLRLPGSCRRSRCVAAAGGSIDNFKHTRQPIRQRATRPFSGADLCRISEGLCIL